MAESCHWELAGGASGSARPGYHHIGWHFVKTDILVTLGCVYPSTILARRKFLTLHGMQKAVYYLALVYYLDWNGIRPGDPPTIAVQAFQL